MHLSTIGSAILAGFGPVGATPTIRSQTSEPTISSALGHYESPTTAPEIKSMLPEIKTSGITVNTTQSPPTLTYLFSATLNLGPALRPITVSGRVREAQALTGRIEGPALNATVTTGIATPMLTRNGSVATVDNTIFGMTDDDYTVFATQVGVGSNKAQNSLLTLEIGGPYTYLTERFIVARISRNDATRQVRLDAYDVV